MSAKSILIDYLKRHTDLNMAVINSLVNSTIEADVEETTLNITPLETEQVLTPTEGEVWTEVTVEPYSYGVPTPIPEYFAVIGSEHAEAENILDILREGVIDPDNFTIEIRPEKYTSKC